MMCAVVVLSVCTHAALIYAQQTNPVDRQVTNPITDTPNINPLTQDLSVPRPQRASTTLASSESTDVLDVAYEKQTISGPENARVSVYEGNVDARVGIYRLQADKITVYEATNQVVAEGNVVFDQGENQRITGTRAEWNYGTKLGYFVNSTGFTNQTQDGTVIYFTADRVDKTGPNLIIATNVELTACEDNVPKWSFRTKRAEIRQNDRVRFRRSTFHVKGHAVAYLPYGSVSLKQRDRASGFLTPTFSFSGNKGFRVSNAYYQTLGRSADITFRNDLYFTRGLGFGADLRTRANSRSFFDAGFFYVKDRILGSGPSPENPDQGGSSFYASGVHYFSNGFTAVADVNITSNLAFRQVFSDHIQQVISPIERSQVFVNKNFRDYSFNLLASTEVASIANARIRTRQLPSVMLDKRPSILGFFKNLPVYFSFESALEGVSRKETLEDVALFTRESGGALVVITPSIVQRLDFNPRFSMPFAVGDWMVTATANLRSTYYSNSIDPITRKLESRDVLRGYGQFELDIRPPALARNFRDANNAFRFRHVIEPYLTYRKIEGINDFRRTILFDYKDAIADTNEIEYGVTNRFFTRRLPGSIGGKPAAATPTAKQSPETNSSSSSMDESAANVSSSGDPQASESATSETAPSDALAAQPYEALSITLRGKYFFDPTFGNAFVPGRRNQFFPINTFSGFSYGGIPRHFSPLNVEARLRPHPELFTDARFNFDFKNGMRDLALSFGLSRRSVQAYQTFYYTRALQLAPSLQSALYADPRGKEPGTLRGAQWSPTLFLGDRNRGYFGGVSFFFDFQNRPEQGNQSLISSTVTLGYAFDCCAITVQNYTFNVGLRNENRLLFGFRLNGIGAFGTDQIGQRFR